jgi:hypothetical protein
LHETKLATDPVTLEADEHLADNDTDDLKVRDRGDPVGVALLVGGPACGPHGRVERSEVTDGEEAAKGELSAVTSVRGCKRRERGDGRDSRITLGEKTETANDISVAVGSERGKGVALEHGPDMLDLALGLGV